MYNTARWLGFRQRCMPVIEFCRPHTVKGTLLASISGYILLSLYTRGENALGTLLLVLLSGVSANVFIVGINQLVDVEIDRINEKKLPIATGELSWITGRNIVIVSLLIAVSVAYTVSVLWVSVILAMCVIGYVYSVPPFRLKRFAVPAAVCIVLARAILGTIGGAITYADAMGKPLDEFALTHMYTFTMILVFFTTVIALMKDVPDIEGDAREGVKSFSVTRGPQWVTRVCYGLMSIMYVFVILLCLDRKCHGFFRWLSVVSSTISHSNAHACALFHVYCLIWLWGRSVQLPITRPLDDKLIREIATHNYLNVIWPLFYAEFFAYLVPIGLDLMSVTIPLWILGIVLGLEASYISSMFPATIANGSTFEDKFARSVLQSVERKSGLNILSIHDNLGLAGPSPGIDLTRCSISNPHIAESAVEVSVALGMHSKLTRLAGKSYSNVKKLGILCGDWLLAKAVVELCETNNKAVHAMGRSIRAATAQPVESLMSASVMEFAEKADRQAGVARKDSKKTS